MSSVKPKPKKKKSPPPAKKSKAILLVLAGMALLLCSVLWASLFKDYPVEGKKQMLAIGEGDTYSGFIDGLAKQDKVSFPVILKLYQKFMIHDTLKAGVYEVREGMSIREVMDMISNVENAQMNRILVIEGTTFKQLIDRLKRDPLVQHDISHLPYADILKALDIPFQHPEGLFSADTYFFAKGESDQKILKHLYTRQMAALDQAWANRASDLPYKDKYEALIMA